LYSHPVPERIGQHFVGGDEGDSLLGKRYVSQAHGTLGLSLRAFVPIFNSSGTQIGVVSVGQLVSDLKTESKKLSSILYYASGISLLVGALGAYLLSRNIKHILFGLEPHEIAALLEERNIIISSIKEGIVAIDRNEKVILINENARKILGIEQLTEYGTVTDIIPNSKLPAVIRSGKPVLDEEQVFNENVVLVNRIPMFSNEEVIGAVATFRDMSEVRTLAEELTSVKQYVEGLRAQQHEFLNKLHVIAGLLQLKQYREAINYTLKIVTKNQDILDTLRSRVEEPTISGLLLAKINGAREAEIEIEISEDSYLPALKEEAISSLVIIMGNLLQNSIEALRSFSSNKRKIHISFSEYKSRFIITIHDTGPRIHDEILSRIYEEGFTTKQESKNAGMGLFLVRQQVERLGGNIRYTYAPRKEFIVSLPKEKLLK
jgi:CitB family two-component system sensor histidine kinase MalK